MKILGIVAVGVVRQSRKFSGHPVMYRAHCAVIFAIAQLSCKKACCILQENRLKCTVESVSQVTQILILYK